MKPDIGGEVAESVKAIFKVGDVPVDWEQINTSGICAGEQDSHEQLRVSIESLKRNKVGLKGELCYLTKIKPFLKLVYRNFLYSCRVGKQPIPKRCASPAA